MKVLVTGVGGQLGYDVMNELYRRGHSGVGTDVVTKAELRCFNERSAAAKAPYRQLDITDKESVDTVLAEEKPDAVLHAAAWTAVDAAEEEINREKVFSVNVTGTENIAKACQRIGCKMTYLSTDYVFNGKGELPWAPDCREYQPLSVYGETKLLGEKAVAQTLDRYFIVRIAWVFGVNGNNFVKTMLRLSETHDSLRVVNDQIGTPTYTADLARLLVDMLETEKYGYYHATNEGGYLSWYEFACEIFRQAGKSVTVTPVSTEEYGVSKANRPLNSRLDKEKIARAGFDRLPDWKDALQRYLSAIGVR
ncbi:MAG: dTDP-4-dehydrorhamnose reductase [Clostridia bacterium]|nr:dTDP-4-dehydrorhamnose reductase [Clostridia bacterium]